jgi:hypothetical protein
MNKLQIGGSIIAGIVSGVFLGLVLKWLQILTDKAVYTLLLNVDYIPIIKEWKLSELMEFNLHLIISILVALVFFYLILHFRLFKKHIVLAVTLASILIGLLLFPSTALSTRTPEITDFMALFYWQIGHALYGLMLGIFLYFLSGRSIQANKN